MTQAAWARPPLGCGFFCRVVLPASLLDDAFHNGTSADWNELDPARRTGGRAGAGAGQ